ncbi:MAG: alanine:cation symporter family protein [Bacilli bacterium]|nr:alanine:cation symporter family protein [Bacilli bacterium]
MAVIYTFKYKFIQLRALGETRKILVKEKNRSAYSTFMLSMASHIGTGNIVGISTALIYGGPGSIFWMWIFAIFSSIFSLIENTLSQVYKEKINGENRGGACFYIRKGLNNKILSIIFAVFLVLTNTVFFQPLQVNTISETINITFGVEKFFIFIGFVIFTYVVIFKGTRRIVKFSEFIVPIMSLTYIAVTSFIIIINFNKVGDMLLLIIKDAFNLNSILAGGCCSCLLIGFRRSMFSHEAGLGTMPSISAMADSKYPVEQGFVSTVGVYVDTLLMCTLTGFTILVFNQNITDFQGVDLIIYIFELVLGKLGFYLAGFFMFTFALATVVGEFYLGESNLLYIIKEKKHKTWYNILYKGLFLFGIFIGTTNNTKDIFAIVDTGMILLGIANIYAILKLKKVFDLELIKFDNSKRII